MVLPVAMMNAMKAAQGVDLSWVNSANSPSGDAPSFIPVNHRKEVTPETVHKGKLDSVASLDREATRVSEAGEPLSDIKRLNDIEGVNPKFIEIYEKLAEKMGISPPPPVYVKNGGSLSSTLTKGGEPVIFMSSEDLSSKPDEILSALAHELQHIKNGDAKTDAIVKRWDHDKYVSQIYQEMIQMELKADEGSAHLCDPSALKRFMESRFQESGTVKMKDIDTGKVYQLERLSDHPSDLERMKNADALPKDTEGCVALPRDVKSIVEPKNLGTPLSHEELREADKIFEQMEKDKSMEIQVPKLPPKSEHGSAMGR